MPSGGGKEGRPVSKLPVSVDLITGGDLEFAGSMYNFPCPFESLPSDYLGYARADLAETSERGNLNAFHNAKRAIASQIDFILHTLRLEDLTKKNLPQKMEVLKTVQILSPSIIERVVKARNDLEHDYCRPSRHETDDAVDIAELFVHATEKWAGMTYDAYFWSSQNRMGGLLDWTDSPQDEARGINFRIHGSLRDDDLDPYNCGGPEPTNKRGLKELGSAFSGLLSSSGEDYLEVLAAMVAAVKNPR